MHNHRTGQWLLIRSDDTLGIVAFHGQRGKAARALDTPNLPLLDQGAVNRTVCSKRHTELFSTSRYDRPGLHVYIFYTYIRATLTVSMLLYACIH